MIKELEKHIEKSNIPIVIKNDNGYVELISFPNKIPHPLIDYIDCHFRQVEKRLYSVNFKLN